MTKERPVDTVRGFVFEIPLKIDHLKNAYFLLGLAAYFRLLIRKNASIKKIQESSYVLVTTAW